MSRAAIPGAQAEDIEDKVGMDNVSVRPYPPSFIDSFTDWVQKLPIPYWLFYVIVILAVIVLHAIIKGLDGSMPFGTFIWRILLADITFIYAIGLLHYLDNSAHEALLEFRPIMQIEDAEFAELRYQFTTLPARPAIIAAVVGLGYGFFSLLFFSPEQRQEGHLFSSLPATVLELALFVLSYLGGAVVLYHSARQLSMISKIYSKYAHIDLFNLRPMHSLSKLTARTALAFGIIAYAWVYVNVALQHGTELAPPSLVEPAVFTLIVLFIFLVPLLGARRLLHEAKATAKLEAQQQFKATIAELHRRRDAGDFSEMGGINEALDGLLKEQAALDKISTWPWQPETLRGIATAVLLPIFIWATTRLLERFWTF